jgi:UDP-N-acetylmuramate--alanine ligase
MHNGKSYFFVGIGGSGMMPLAMILAGRGATVAGSDRSLDSGRLPAKFENLRRMGIALFPQDGSGIVSAEQIVVASAAIEDTVADMIACAKVGAARMSRAELLASLFNDAGTPIGVAGTSGKSTVTGMIGWILHAVGRDPTVMNGAVMKNFASPDAPFASALVGQGNAFVSEVDESDGSIALYRPQVAVLNNVSLDHKSMEELRELFGAFVAKARTAVINAGDAEAAALAGQAKAVVTFAVEAAGVSRADAVKAVEGFTGLKRRFELVGEAGGVAVIDDFGHNPDKIAATLDTLHAFPGRLLLLFQPHGYGPLKVMRAELAAMFRDKLGADDLLVLPDPAYFGGTTNREVTSADVVSDIGRNALHIPDRAEAAAHIVAEARPGDRIVVMGARDDTLSLLAAEMVEKLGWE